MHLTVDHKKVAKRDVYSYQYCDKGTKTTSEELYTLFQWSLFFRIWLMSEFKFWNLHCSFRILTQTYRTSIHVDFKKQQHKLPCKVLNESNHKSLVFVLLMKLQSTYTTSAMLASFKWKYNCSKINLKFAEHWEFSFTNDWFWFGNWQKYWYNSSSLFIGFIDWETFANEVVNCNTLSAIRVVSLRRTSFGTYFAEL